MTADTPAAAARALILLFRENAIPMSDRNSFLYTILEDALSAPVAAPPADPLLGQALAALVRYANACDADAKTVAVIQALEERIDAAPVFHLRSFGDVTADELERLTAAPPAASGVDAVWVQTVMDLADEMADHAAKSTDAAADGFLKLGKREHLAEKSARDALRTHLSTALKEDQRG